AWVLFVNGKYEACKQQVNQVEAQIMPQGENGEYHEVNIVPLHPGALGRPNPKSLVLTLKGQLSVMHGETQKGIEQLEAGLRELNDELEGLKSFVIHQLRLAYWINGDFEAAENIVHRFQVEDSATGDTATIIALLNQAERHFLHGELKQAASLYQRLLQVLSNQDREAFFPAAVAHVDLGMILYEWNDLDGAEYHARKGIELGSRALGTVRAIAAGYFGLIQSLRAKNNLAEAARMADEMDELLQEVNLGFQLPISKVLRIPLWITQNDQDTVRKVFPVYKMGVLSQFASKISKLTSLIAQLSLFLNEFDEVSTIASNLLLTADAQNIDDRINGHVLLALVHQARDDHAQALTDLTAALVLAEPEGYIRTFIDYGQPMTTLLRDVAASLRKNGSDRQPTIDYIHTLLKVAQPLDAPSQQTAASASETTASPLIEPLTDREMDVLHLLAKGYSNRKIAAELVITPGTVKIHTSHIYSKLEVSNRTQAVAKARELAILLAS
ncbi:MAG: hypothetical protein KDJ65_33960, partial [Anaerolineae bacterium]|nr:hypothetical protein [Anaerolineae bacterium]